MSTVTLPVGGNFFAFDDFVGNRGAGFSFDEITMEYESGVAQAALDAALINYVADQATIDADFADDEKDRRDDEEKDRFDEKDDLTALIKEMVDQLNVLRALHALPDLNFGTVNASIRSRIGQP